jgi:hypothetical protein
MTHRISTCRLVTEMDGHKEVYMQKQILKRLVILPVLVLLIMLVASPAWAADLRGGDTVIIASGDVVNDDLYMAATRIIINGTVNGDVLCVGETVDVNGKINGSITAIAPTITIDGEVTHSVRAAGSNIRVGGTIGGDLITAGDDVNIDSTTLVGRDLVFAARKIRVDAQIDNSLKGVGTTVRLSNLVGGNAEIGVEKLTLTYTANIQGSLTYISQNEATILSGAHIGGTTSHQIPEARKSVFTLKINVWTRVIAFLMTLITGCLIILLAPKRAAAVAASLKRKPWLILGWGAIILFATPIAAIITFVTVIGVPVGLIGLVLYGIAIYLSQIAVGLFLGYWIMGTFSQVNSRGLLIGAFALGFVILTLIRAIPYIGIPVWLATILFGLGAMALSQRTLRAEATVKVPETTT